MINILSAEDKKILDQEMGMEQVWKGTERMTKGERGLKNLSKNVRDILTSE